jgi:quercetin dioxygenase-like cupin family protein
MRTATVHQDGSGEQRWFLNTLTTIKVAAAQTGGVLDVVEQVLPAGYAPPMHLHREHDEVLVVLEGEGDLTCGAHRWAVAAGSVAHVPREVPHALEVSLAAPARILLVSTPASFAALVAELGQRLSGAAPPGLVAPDLAELVRVGERHDVHLVPDALSALPASAGRPLG